MTRIKAVEFAKKRIKELRIQKRLGHHPETGVAWQSYHQDLLDLFVEGLKQNGPDRRRLVLDGQYKGD